MIVLDEVSKSYDGGHFAVRDVSLRVQEGSLLVLLGGSGCGKTTTLQDEEPSHRGNRRPHRGQ